MEKKAEAILRLANGKKLIKLGRSYAIVLPRSWIDVFGYEVAGSYWVKFDQSGNSIKLEPLDDTFVKELMEANDVRI